MPDLLAGTTILALDTPPTQFFTQGNDELAFTSQTYIPGASSCGVTFVAPTTGRVKVNWHSRFQSNTTGPVRTALTVQIREGATVGSGTIVETASDAHALETPQDDPAGGNTRQGEGTFRIISDLTPGQTYNAQLMHRMMGAGNGTVFDRSISVTPQS